MGEEDQTPTQEEQKEVVAILLGKPLLEGEIWYLVDSIWMKALKRYLGFTGGPCHPPGMKTRYPPSFHPGPIDNQTLLNADNSLKDNLTEEADYCIVPEDLWTKLVEWYGVSHNQLPIPRRVIRLSPTYTILEIYLLTLKCNTDFSMKSEDIMLQFSRTTPLKVVENSLRVKCNIDKNLDTRLWLSVSGSLFELVDTEKTLNDLGVGLEGSCVVIESKKPNVPWSDKIGEFTPLNMSTNKSNNFNDLVALIGPPKVSRMTSLHQPGVCGLNNLGNTCFMNSVLQCMSNCPPVTEYFLAERHLEELNRVNPLGMRGEIAVAFGGLINLMWSGNHSHTSPIQFKIQLGRFNPVFSGCQQHDSQELLTFLLDGLHEDLNRIKQKPYTEINDDSDREDKILAQEAWDRHRKRNDSIIVDTFHGLLKSRVICPDCRKLSVTFDPFCNLSLPLPQKKDRLVTITFIPFEGNKQNFKCSVSIPRQGIIKDLCRVVGLCTNTDSNRLLVAEITHSHFHKFYCSEDSLDSIQDRDRERDLIYVYELPEWSDCNETKQQLLIPVCCWEINELSNKFEHNQLFGIPFFISVPKQPISENCLRVLLLEKMLRHFSIPALNGYDPSDTDNGSVELVNENMKDLWFKIFTKNTAERTPPTLLEFNKRKLDLLELFDVEDSSELFFGRNMIILGFTKKLRKEDYLEKAVGFSHEKTRNYRQAMREREQITIYECLNLFTTYEKLGAHDAWYCPTCKKHQRATKKFDLWDLPKILIVHLKRFSYTRLLRDKIDAMVDCPVKNLDLSEYLMQRDRPQGVYNLIGVCNHYGGMGGGHYTASCKNKDTGDWFYFDDSNVQPISEDRVVTPAAYVLFYMANER